MTEPVLPDRADDDTDVGWGEIPPGDDDRERDDARLHAERPPHHDRDD